MADAQLTVTCAQPVACDPRVTAALITVVPEGVGTLAWKWPVASATVVTTAVVSEGDPGWPAEMTTVAPGVVVPLTMAWDPELADPEDGDVIDIGSAAGGPDRSPLASGRRLRIRRPQRDNRRSRHSSARQFPR